MSNSTFGWQSLLDSERPESCSLIQALFTTYDQPDSVFLAEQLLPKLFNLDRLPYGEGFERQYFLIGLDAKLKELHNKIVVVSSFVRDEPSKEMAAENRVYGWIWNSIRHLMVGQDRAAVQHAKLWMLHWKNKNTKEQWLEIVISSTNLTGPAFKSQLQAAWTCCVPLENQTSQKRLKSWGVLPSFLDELFKSAGGHPIKDSMLALLGRADCRKDVSFVASIPGKFSEKELQRKSWGSAGLSKIRPSGTNRVTTEILCPYIGIWDGVTLKNWCESFGGSTDCLNLAWIEKDHPWAKNWIMPRTTLDALTSSESKLLQIRHNSHNKQEISRFHNDHQPADIRWSHAKIYCFRSGRSKRLLITSANFSPSAWGGSNGNGSIEIKNFELGVCVEQAETEIWECLENFDEANPATIEKLQPIIANNLLWGQATWNGNVIEIQCRAKSSENLTGAIEITGKPELKIENWQSGSSTGLHSAVVDWTEQKNSPTHVRLQLEIAGLTETIVISVFDVRPSHQREQCLPPLDVDPETAQRLMDEVLFDKYGGALPSEESGDLNGSKISEEADLKTSVANDDYSVAAFVLARQHLAVVDNWQQAIDTDAETNLADSTRFERRLRDGRLLIEAFERQHERDKDTELNQKEPGISIGTKLAIEELTVRLQSLSETKWQ